MSEKLELSIVILSYNTKDLLKNCLDSLEKRKHEVKFKVIVVDNGSIDKSVEMVKKDFSWVRLVENESNLGFAAGNNRAQGLCQGEYILFLNSDTLVNQNTLKETLAYLKGHPKVGAVTCKIKLPSGDLDKDARRSFPTPWVAFSHLSGLDRLFPSSKVFAKYWYGYKSADKIQEIDVLQGAFCMVRRQILDDLDWFDESYFLDGEDIDLCWRMKEKGWKNIYYPKVSIIHLKGVSKGKKGKVKTDLSLSEKRKFVMAGVNSMEIFYRKRLWKNYPLLFNLLLIGAIKILKMIRYVRLLVL